MEWKFIGAVSNDSFVINGTDVFKEKWIKTDEHIIVKDPLYGQKHDFYVKKM